MGQRPENPGQQYLPKTPLADQFAPTDDPNMAEPAKRFWVRLRRAGWAHSLEDFVSARRSGQGAGRDLVARPIRRVTGNF